jgi:hypothetical protein
MSLKAFEKFKKCRTEASQNSLKKSKNIVIDVRIDLFRCIIYFLRTWRQKNRISLRGSEISSPKNHLSNSRRYS